MPSSALDRQTDATAPVDLVRKSLTHQVANMVRSLVLVRAIVKDEPTEARQAISNALVLLRRHTGHHPPESEQTKVMLGAQATKNRYPEQRERRVVADLSPLRR